MRLDLSYAKYFCERERENERGREGETERE